MTDNQNITLRLRHILEDRGVSVTDQNVARWAQAHGLDPVKFLTQFHTHAYTLHTIQVLLVALHDVSADYLLCGVGYVYRDPQMVHITNTNTNTVSGNSSTTETNTTASDITKAAGSPDSAAPN